LVLKEWVDQPEFSRILQQCTDESIEVFWKTPTSICG
jgi:hypothetical protein